MAVYQIAAGDGSRQYPELFVDFDVAAIGSGKTEKYREERYDELLREGWDKPGIDTIRRFALNPKAGDVFLLRVGHSVEAVGVIPADEADAGYEWREDFIDVLGWDLRHTRRVLWSKEAVAALPYQPFESYKQQPKFTRVKLPDIQKAEDELRNTVLAERTDLKPLPQVPPVLSDSDLGRELFRDGLPDRAVVDVISTLQKTDRLTTWYSSDMSGTRPTEHEIVAHIVVPLLLGLGWSEQLMAVEWKSVDVALFQSAPTTEDTCVAVIEVKARGAGLDSAYSQAQAYVEEKLLGSTRTIVTTDGRTMFVYRRPMGHDAWPESPTEYVNLRHVRTRNLLPTCTSGVGALLSLLPTRICQ